MWALSGEMPLLLLERRKKCLLQPVHKLTWTGYWFLVLALGLTALLLSNCSAKEPLPQSDPASDAETSSVASELVSLGLPTAFGKKARGCRSSREWPAARMPSAPT